MLPDYYECTNCQERFDFVRGARQAFYCFNSNLVPLGGHLSDSELFPVPVRPGWCKHCASVCVVEDIAPVQAFEDAYGAVRMGRTVDYPESTENLEPQQAHEMMATYLRWRLERRHPPRALCCGGRSYQLLDVPQPLLKHAECDFGVVEPRHVFLGSYNGPGPGVYSPANFPVYCGEGVLIGLLTWRPRLSTTWEVVAAEYARSDEV